MKAFVEHTRWIIKGIEIDKDFFQQTQIFFWPMVTWAMISNCMIGKDV